MSRFWILWITLASVRGHQLQGFDCEQPTHTQDIGIRDSCRNQGLYQRVLPHKLAILQKNEVRMVEGYSCTRISSTFDLFCGAFSHEKFAAIPRIKIKETVPHGQCKAMIMRQRIVSAQGVTTTLELDAETILYSTPIGEFGEHNHNIECEGQKVKINGRVIEEIVEMRQVKIGLRREKLKWKGDQGESQAYHEKLPRRCKIFDLNCETPDKTFIWEKPRQSCLLEKVRDTEGIMEGNVFIDERNLIRLEVRQPYTASFLGCPELEVYKTNYPNLFVVNPDDIDTPLATLTETGLDIEEYVNAQDDFLAYELERRIGQMAQNRRTSECFQEIQHGLHQDQIIKIGKQSGLFGRMKGEALSLLNCKEVKITPVEQDDHCYYELPVHYKDQTYFLEPITRRLKKYGTEQSCEAILASQFQTMDGAWITLTPQIHVIPAPRNITLLSHDGSQHHIDMSQGGIFTHQQLRKWELAASFPDYHQALGRRVTVQACQEEGCTNGPVTSTGSLRTMMENGIGIQSLEQRILNVLQTIGQVTSVIVALVWGLQLLYRLVMCGQICRTEGAGTALNFGALFFTKDHLLVKEYHKEYKRAKTEEPEDPRELDVIRFEGPTTKTEQEQ